MAYEIDYIPVGEGESCGDAIAMRFGNFSGPRNEQAVVIIDGGYQSAAEQMVEHIRSYYGTDIVDLVISTHPDHDHVSGLHHVLEEMQVQALLMHKPWDHAQDIRELFQNGRVRALGISERLERSLQAASDLEELAKRKGIPMEEPFRGGSYLGDTMHILGPSNEFYDGLLLNFRGLPTAASALASLAPAPVRRVAEETVQWIQDNITLDLLNDDADSTSAENNTSTIILFVIDGRKLLFTGDAGKTALLHAADYAEANGVPLTGLDFLDVPHHGSRRNLSSGILKRIQGNAAFISVARESKKHPSKKVVNALQKHGMRVFTNRGGIVYHHDPTTPLRAGWGHATPEPFHEVVEA